MIKYLQQQVQPSMLLLLMASIIALTLMAAYLYLFKQPLKEYRQLHQKLELLKDEIQTGIPVSKQIDNTEKNLLELKNKLYGTAPQLPINQKIASVIGQLDTISSGQKVNLTSIKPGEVTQLFLLQEQPFTIEISGSYFSLFNWLYQVEEELGPILVKEFDISSDTSKLRMKLTLVSYQFAPGNE
jgi:Tfp pilus assembly protein PilO